MSIFIVKCQEINKYKQGVSIIQVNVTGLSGIKWEVANNF